MLRYDWNLCARPCNQVQPAFDKSDVSQRYAFTAEPARLDRKRRTIDGEKPVRKDQETKIVRAFNAKILSTDSLLILISSIFFSVIYVYLAEPSRMASISRTDVALIILIYSLLHTFLALIAFARIAIFLSKKNLQIIVAAVVTCCLTNAIAILLRYLLLPFNTHGFADTSVMVASISITATLLTLPGWVFMAYRNRHHFIAALQNAGIAVKEGPAPSVFQDELQKLLPASKRGHLLLLKASGNYTEVITSAGSYMLRIGIGEAERSTTAKGLRVHKSYWVARDEILRLVYISGNPQIVTQSGESIPVSRSVVPALRAILSETGPAAAG